MVFEKTNVPKTKGEFMKWFKAQVEWGEEHGYQTASVASSALQNWYCAMKNSFPSMNGVDAPTEEEFRDNDELEERLTEYCIGRDLIYASFAWSMADEAYELMKQLAQEHDVGFFDVGADNGDIILPDGTKLL